MELSMNKDKEEAGILAFWCFFVLAIIGFWAGLYYVGKRIIELL